MSDAPPPGAEQGADPRGDPSQDEQAADSAARKRRIVGAAATAVLFGLGMFGQFGELSRGCGGADPASTVAGRAEGEAEFDAGAGGSTSSVGAAAPRAAPSPAAQQALADSRRHQAAGDLEAADQAAQRVVEAGYVVGGRLEQAKLAITRGRDGQARKILEPLVVAAPDLAAVHYNLALVEQRAEHYNQARSGYLRTLQLDPSFKAARYNLAVLAFDNGIVAEARHHAQAYATLDPASEASRILFAKVGITQAAATP